MRRRLAFVILGGLAVVVAVAAGALAFWSSHGNAAASATTGALTAPGKPGATTSGGSVSVAWTAATVSDGGTVSYVVQRRPAAGATYVDSCGSTAAVPITTASCNDAPGGGAFVYRVRAVYRSWTHTGVDSDTVTVSNETTTTVTSSPNSSVAGQGVTLTATVTATTGTPTGTVTFTDGGVGILCTGGTQTLNAGGTATCTVAFGSAGTHTINATYAGDSSFTGSVSADHPHAVNKASTSTTLVSSVNPSVSGQTVTYTATVTTTAPGTGVATGAVTFKDGTSSITCTGGTQTLNGSGVATCSLPYAVPATHSVTAAYAGDTNYLTSTSSAVSQVVNRAATSTALVSSVNPSVTGQTVTYTATVTAVSPGTGTPTGSVTFKDGAATVTCAGGTQTLDSSGVATCSLSYPAQATHPITAVYAGDTNFSTSTSSAVSQVVNKASTATALVSSVNPSVTGQTVTYTATVTAASPGTGTPTGSVTFKDGAATVTCAGGTQTLNGSGVATCSLGFNATAGSHSITAVYAGDTGFLTSTSAAVSQAVNKASTTTALVSSANPSQTGAAVTFSATVAAASPGGGTPTGNVEFFDGAIAVAACGGTAGNALTGGVATCVQTYNSVSSHTITSQYLGSANYTGSSSTAVTQSVVAPTSITNLVLSNKTGGTAGKAEAGDKITVTFSAGLKVSSVCSAWSGDATNQTNATANVHITGNAAVPAANNIVSISSWSACPSFAFASIDLGSKNYVTSTGQSNKPADFAGSTVAYDATAHTLTITLGTEALGGGQGTTGAVAASTATLTADSGLLDVNGFPMSPLTKATANIQQF